MIQPDALLLDPSVEVAQSFKGIDLRQSQSFRNTRPVSLRLIDHFPLMCGNRFEIHAKRNGMRIHGAEG